MTDSFNIIMNPPYSGRLHLQILEKALTFKSDNGTCICLHPNTFRLHLGQYINQKGEYCAKHLKDYSIIPHNEANAFFGTGNLIEELIIGVYDTKECRDAPFSEVVLNIYNKISKYCVFTGAFKSKENRIENCSNKPNLKFECWGVPSLIDLLRADTDGKKVSYAVVYNTEVEKANHIYFLQNSFIGKFLLLENKSIELFSLRTRDFSHKLTNEELAAYMNLTDEEILYLKNNKCWKDTEGWEDKMNKWGWKDYKGNPISEESLKKLDYLMHDYDIHVFRANEYYINDKPLCQLRTLELHDVDTDIN